jgi:diguanylate cyclase (GGDEF)-like protein
MGGIRSFLDGVLRRRVAPTASIAPTANPKFGNATIHGSILIGLFSMGVIWLGAWYIANEDAKRTESTAYQDTANLARAFEEHIIRLIQAHDQILLFARTSYAKNPDNFDLGQWSRDQHFATDVTLQIATTDKDGILTGSNLGMPAARTDLSDREHFRVHADSDRDELFISKPTLGRVSGKWSIQLSRRVTATDGSFGGVVIISIDPSYLASFYESIDVNKNGMVFLVGLDGIVRARLASGNQTVGQSLKNSTLFNRLAQAPSGSFLAGGQMDGISRLSSYRQIRGYPLVVVVGFSRAEVFASAEYRRIVYFAAAGLIGLIVLGFKAIVVRHQFGLQRARDKLWEAANFDSLTGLPNRNRLHEVVNAIISDPQGQREPFALLLLDLDNFKFVNDTLGHEAGDLVLRTAAERIQRMARGAHVVARLGGDEFAVLLRGVMEQKEIDRIARRVLRALRRKMNYRGHSIEIYASIGIACFPDHASTWGDIFRDADLALYRAKQAGRNRTVVFDPSMLLAAENRFGVLGTVRSALEHDRVVPFYQSEISIETGEIVGFEALARIVREDGSLSVPAEFMSALEDPDVGRAFGLRMIERVTRDMQIWLAAGFDIKRVAVNVSNLELRSDDYSERVVAKLQERGIGFDRFEIEVTETAAIDDNIAAIGRNLRSLAANGISIALDDFGTGFASLTHLKSLPITRVKIDRSFVGNIVSDPESRSIVDAIVRLSHSLGKSVVVEGVEDEAQFAATRELKCDIAQGYLFSRPVPAHEVATLLLRNAAQRLGRPTWRDSNEADTGVAIKKAS